MVVWLTLIAAMFGHFALHLAIYNRLNATGFRRVTIKRVEKLFIATCILIPIVMIDAIVRGMSADGLSVDLLPRLPVLILGYGVVCLGSLVVFGIPWILWRPLLAIESVDAPRKVSVVDVENAVGQSLALSRKCRWQSKIPFNQIFELAIEQSELPVVGLPRSLDGLRISHLSDLHFTGDISAKFADYVITESNRWQPDLCVITGDIIDKQRCIAWLGDIFENATAKSGRYFILGNHDTRVRNPNEIREAMTNCGWTDVGGRRVRSIISDTEIEIIGNESPWFAAPKIDDANFQRDVDAGPFRLLLSHSPDQLTWARRHHVGLMLAGHTHGGQGRLPLAGPLLSPSWHGSRYASGDFYKAPTTMHVTRGLGGVHLLRMNCRPELSLLTLRAVMSPSRREPFSQSNR